jgi:hypothetical protein
MRELPAGKERHGTQNGPIRAGSPDRRSKSKSRKSPLTARMRLIPLSSASRPKRCRPGRTLSLRARGWTNPLNSMWRCRSPVSLPTRS